MANNANIVYLNYIINAQEKEEKRIQEEKEEMKKKYGLEIYLLTGSSKDEEKIKKEITSIKIENEELKVQLSDYWIITSFIGNISDQIEESYKKFDKKMNDINSGKEVFKEVFIIQVEKLCDIIVEKVIEKFNDLEENLQPFIIFIPSSNNKEDNEKVIQNTLNKFKKFEPKNIFCEHKLCDIRKKICQFCAYYNELGDILYAHEVFSAYINIFCIGDVGSGKSTFINLLLKEKRAKVGGDGLHCTKYINYYQIQNYPIKLYDLPGIENNATEKDNLDLLEKVGDLKKDLHQKNDKIHLILFFIDGGSQVKFRQILYDIIKIILDIDTKILFIETHSNFNKEKNDEYKNYKKNSEIIRNCIRKIIKDDEKINRFLPVLQNGEIGNFFSINMKEKVISTIKIPIFGVDNLLENIAKIFEEEKQIFLEINNILENNEIDEPFSNDEIKNKIQNSYFLKNFKNFDSYLQAKEEEAKELIGKTIWQAFVIGIVPFLDIYLQYKVNQRIRENLEQIYGFKVDIPDPIEMLKEEERKELETEEKDKNTNTKGFILKLISRIASLGSNCWNLLTKVAISIGKGTLGIIFAGIGVVFGIGSSAYMIYRDGIELIPIFNKHFSKKKKVILKNYIKNFLKGVEFFEKFTLITDDKITDGSILNITEEIKSETSTLIIN